MKRNIHVWSVPLKPLRPIQQALPCWVNRFFSYPVHTFVTVEEPWVAPPFSPEAPKGGYWYCAGDFCSTSGDGVVGFSVGDVDVGYASCLVKPDIALDDPRHEHEVIGGAYGVDFVCHNIANRILHATGKSITLVDTSLPLTGYKSIVNSPLGIYGRNKREWELAIGNCSTYPRGPQVTSPNLSLRSRENEILRIHTRAAAGDARVGQNITVALKQIDELYFNMSNEIFYAFTNSEIGEEEFNHTMDLWMLRSIQETEKVVGISRTQDIYGLYSLTNDDASTKQMGSA